MASRGMALMCLLTALGVVRAADADAAVQTVTIASLTAPDAPPAAIVSGALDAEFEPRAGATIPLRAAPGTWWRVTPRVTLEPSLSPVLELSDVLLAQVEVWRRGRSEPARYSTYGPTADERSSSRGLAIPLPDGVTAGDAIYLRIEARGVAPLRVGLESRAQSLRLDTQHAQILAALLTVMLVTCILALGFGLGLGERSYLYFAVMVLCQMAYLALVGGGFRYLPATSEVLDRNLQALRVAGSLGTIGSIEFLRMYLDLARRRPLLSRMLLACSVLLGIGALASMATAASWTALLGNLMLLIASAILLVATLRGCIDGQRAAWFVLGAWVPTMLMATLRALEALGWVVGPAWLAYLFPASFAFACLMLTLGLTDRMLTIRRERHEALLESQRRARQLATASHDIRQPLLALRTGLMRLAAENALAPGAAERFSSSLDYLDRLAAEYAPRWTAAPEPASDAERAQRPEAATVPAPEVLAVDLLLRNIELMFRDEAEAKGLSFRVRSSAATVTADGMAAMRIVSNLVANAVKYTRTGKVLVGCRRRRDRIVIVVADTGPGMTAEELARVQQEGERGASAAGTEGSGLGLSIATRLAADCGFALHIVSTPGRGTMLGFELPRR